MQKLLSETQTMVLSNETDAQTLFEKIDKATIWQRCYTNELVAVGLDNIPICLDSIRATLKASPEVSDESILENMENLNLGLQVPFSNGYQGHPLGDTAFSTLIQRAGYGSSPALLNLSEKSTQTIMPPEFRAFVINKGLSCYKNRALVMIRDEKVRAVLSGDESDYSPLPFSELNVAFKTGLKKQFNEVFFSSASVDHCISATEYLIKDENLNNDVKSVFANAGFNMDNTYIAAKLISSDVGLSGANIYPYLSSPNRSLMIGVPITLTHKNRHTIANFSANVEKVISMFKDAKEKLELMQQNSVKHPEGCLLRLAKQVGLSKKLSCEAAPEFAGVFGHGATQLDIFWELQDIYAAMISEKISESRKIQLQENIARICFGNISDYDMPFQWE